MASYPNDELFVPSLRPMMLAVTVWSVFTLTELKPLALGPSWFDFGEFFSETAIESILSDGFTEL